MEQLKSIGKTLKPKHCAFISHFRQHCVFMTAGFLHKIIFNTTSEKTLVRKVPG